jgi:hypothetical protein
MFVNILLACAEYENFVDMMRVYKKENKEWKSSDCLKNSLWKPVSQNMSVNDNY